MKYLILLNCLLFSLPSFSINGDCGSTGLRVFQMQTRIDSEFVDEYKGKYEFANIHCRRNDCMRASHIITEDDGDPDTGRLVETITSISCTKDRELGFLYSVRHPIIASYLNTTFEFLKGTGKLPLLETENSGPSSTHEAPNNNRSTSGTLD